MNQTTIKNLIGAALFSAVASASEVLCCTIYSKTHMNGDSYQLCSDGPDDYETPDPTVYDIKDGGYVTWQAQSIECDFKATYTPCSASTSDADCKINAHWWSYQSGGSNVDISSVDASKIAINSVTLGTPNGGGDFSAYENDDCSGASFSYPIRFDAMNYEQLHPQGDDITLQPHGKIAIPGFSLKSGDIKSVRIPNGFAVKFYDQDWGTWISQQTPFVTHFGMVNDVCQKLEQKGNLKSIHLQVDDSANGQWVQLSQTSQGVDYKYTVGIKSTDSSASSQTNAKSLEASIEDGFKLLGYEVSVNLSKSISQQATQTVQTVSKKDITKELDFSCKPEKHSKDGASLWQWQITNAEATAQSETLICRTGKYWNSAPKCPPSACKHANCEECTDGWKA